MPGFVVVADAVAVTVFGTTLIFSLPSSLTDRQSQSHQRQSSSFSAPEHQQHNLHLQQLLWQHKLSQYSSTYQQYLCSSSLPKYLLPSAVCIQHKLYQTHLGYYCLLDIYPNRYHLKNKYIYMTRCFCQNMQIPKAKHSTALCNFVQKIMRSF